MHPAHEHVRASRKRREALVEGRLRRGKRDRPGLAGGASEDREGQSTAKPAEEHERRGVPLLSVPRAHGGRLTAHERQGLPRSDFALPGQNHGRNALARVAQHGTPAEKAKVRAAVHRKFPGIKEG